MVGKQFLDGYKKFLAFVAACVFLAVGRLSGKEWLIAMGIYVGGNVLASLGGVLGTLLGGAVATQKGGSTGG